jgi:hypothetical protein
LHKEIIFWFANSESDTEWIQQLPYRIYLVSALAVSWSQIQTNRMTRLTPAKGSQPLDPNPNPNPNPNCLSPSRYGGLDKKSAPRISSAATYILNLDKDLGFSTEI